jgi:hypothetical protein
VFGTGEMHGVGEIIANVDGHPCVRSRAAHSSSDLSRRVVPIIQLETRERLENLHFHASPAPAAPLSRMPSEDAEEE